MKDQGQWFSQKQNCKKFILEFRVCKVMLMFHKKMMWKWMYLNKCRFLYMNTHKLNVKKWSLLKINPIAYFEPKINIRSNLILGEVQHVCIPKKMCVWDSKADKIWKTLLTKAEARVEKCHIWAAPLNGGLLLHEKFSYHFCLLTTHIRLNKLTHIYWANSVSQALC